MSKDGKLLMDMVGSDRNSAVPSGSLRQPSVLVTTKIGTTERKIGAAPNIRPFLLITSAPLTESVCASKEPTPCVQNVNATTPNSKKLTRNGFGSVMGRARQI